MLGSGAAAAGAVAVAARVCPPAEPVSLEAQECWDEGLKARPFQHAPHLLLQRNVVRQLRLLKQREGKLQEGVKRHSGCETKTSVGGAPLRTGRRQTRCSCGCGFGCGRPGPLGLQAAGREGGKRYEAGRRMRGRACGRRCS